MMRLLWLGGLVALTFLSANPTFAQLDNDDFFDRGRDLLEEEIERLEDPEPRIDLNIPPSQADIPWHQVVATEGAQFTAVMPGPPQTYDPVAIATSEGEIEIVGWLTLYNNTQFLIAYGEYADTAIAPEVRLSDLRDRLVTDTGWTISTDTAIGLGDYPGREFVLADEGRKITYRVYLIAAKLYILGVVETGDTAAESDAIAPIANTFLNSFQTLPEDYKLEDLLPPGSVPIESESSP
jgi:hypothetical protein